MVNNVDNQLRSLINIAHMTIINAIFSIVIGVSFYFNIALTNAGGIPVALQNNPVVYIPSWIFIIQVVDFFLVLSLWRNFYKIQYKSVGRLTNFHVAIMSVIILGANQITVFTALGHPNVTHRLIANINLIGAAYGMLSAAVFYASKYNKQISSGEV